MIPKCSPEPPSETKERKMMEQTDFFQKLNDHVQGQKAFVAYRKPGSSTVKALLQKDKISHKINACLAHGLGLRTIRPMHKTQGNHHTVMITWYNQNLVLTSKVGGSTP